MFKVFDIDPNTALNHDDFLGSTLTTLEQIVNRKTFSDDLLSKRGNIHGQIHVNCEPLSLNSDKVLFTLRGKNLTKMDWGPLAKSDPYFVVSRDSTDTTSSSSSGATQLNLYKSEVIDRNLNPIWECASITLDKLCLGDMNRPFKITVYDHDKMKSDDMIGYAVVSMMNMRMAYDNNTSLQLTGPHAKKSELLVLTFSVQRAIPYMPIWSTGTGSSNMNNPVPQQQLPMQPQPTAFSPPAYSGAPAHVYGSNVGPPAYGFPPTTAYGAIYPPQTPPMYNPYGGSQPQQPPAYGFVQPQQQPQQQMASPPQYNQPPPPQYNQPPAYNQPPQYDQPPQYQ